MGYTASDNVASVKLKGFLSGATGLSDANILTLLDDAQRSYIVPFLKAVRDEWFVKGTETVTADANGRIPLPNSVASTIRTIFWVNNGVLVPLPRIEPERMYAYINQGAGQPCGYMLKGYEIQLLPNNVGSVSVRLDFMERPASLVLEGDAGEIESHAGLVLTLADVPLAWQSTAPTSVDLISNVSPFSPVAEDVACSLSGSDLTLTGISASLIEDGFWVADVGTSPYPNLPPELHPLLQQSVITTLYTSLGDARLKGAVDLQMKMEGDLRKTLAPRTQGSARPIVNPSAPGMRSSWSRGW